MSRGIDWVAWPPSSHRPPLDDPGPSECKRQRYGEGGPRGGSPRRGFSPENSRLGESENSDDDTADDQPGQEEEEEEEEADDEVIDLTAESDPEVLSEEEVMEEEEEEEEEPLFSTMHLTGGAPPESLEEKEEEKAKKTTATAGTLTPLLPLWHVLQMNKQLTLADYQALRLVCRHLSRELPVLRLGGHDRVCFSYLVNKSIAHNR